MAIKSRDPTRLGERQLAQTLKSVFERNAQFVPLDRARKWFGRMDEKAARKVRKKWDSFVVENYSEYADWSKGKRVPKLLIGVLSKPKGYVFVRDDQKNRWLHKA
jgi:cobalamin biosynthesis Mg chelatase CobN